MTCLAAFCLIGAIAIDGDTLKVPQPGPDFRVRIWGINAPELDQPGGGASRELMRVLIAGKTIACDDRGRDRYGRQVSRCWLPDGRDLACAMVATGLARDWPKYSKGAYARCARR